MEKKKENLLLCHFSHHANFCHICKHSCLTKEKINKRNNKHCGYSDWGEGTEGASANGLDWISLLLLTEDMGFCKQKEITGEDRVACANFVHVLLLPC